MNGRHWLELGFMIIVLGDILMHAQAFAQVTTATSASYNGIVKTFEGL